MHALQPDDLHAGGLALCQVPDAGALFSDELCASADSTM